jgi:hypothetical protein
MSIMVGAMILVAAVGPVSQVVTDVLGDMRTAPVAAVRAAPLEIPEPVTIILFGTGLAVMAAAATVKRKR